MIVVGFDPGSAHFARCVLDVTPTSATFVSCGVFEVGHIVPLKKPRRFRDGRMQTEERIVDAADVEELSSHVRGLLASLDGHYIGSLLCACERRARISPRKGNMVSAELASQLATAKELGGGAVEIARFIGYRISLVTPEEWRKALCGDHHADDKMVGAAIPLAIAGWPKRSNPHERDAAGVALYAARRFIAGH